MVSSLLHRSFEPIARFYDSDYRNFRADLPLLLELAQEMDGPVLELGCGTGRILLPLAEAGHSSTGVDSSPGLLALARAKLQASPVASRVTLVQGDLRTFDLLAQGVPAFAFACCASNTLMHLPDQDAQVVALANAARHLRPGGGLCVDLFQPDPVALAQVSGLQELADSWIDETSGAVVYKWSVRTLDLAAQCQETLFVYEELFSNGRVRRTPFAFTLRFLWRSEGELMLAKAGLEVEDVWGDYDASPYVDGCERLIFWARKPA